MLKQRPLQSRGVTATKLTSANGVDFAHEHAEAEVDGEEEVAEGRWLGGALEDDDHAEGVRSQHDCQNDGESAQVVGYGAIHHCDQRTQTLGASNHNTRGSQWGSHNG